MNEADAKLTALRHYRTIWFGKTWEETLPLWETEYAAVSTGAFKPLQILSSNMDGVSHSGAANFEQSIRVAALQEYRASKDADYAAEIFAPGATDSTTPSVMYPLFSPGAFHW